MLLLEAVNIKKYYADRLIIEMDGLRIYTGDRIGVVGMNGSGKTTLLNILSGCIEPDEGFVKRYCEVAYIRQFDEEETDNEYGQESAEETGASRKLLKEFELDQKLQREALSGGERTRLKIAGAFSRDNVLLFADEPTSNLDYEGIGLLKKKLERLESFVLISHDRSLLDMLCTRILEIRDGKTRTFNGNYSSYRQQCEMERERTAVEYQKYIDEKTSLEDAISNRKHRAKKMRKAPKRMGNSEARLHTRAANEKQEKLHDAANSLITRLEKLEVKEKPRELPTIKLDFSLTSPPENRFVITCEKLSFSYGPTVPVFQNAGFSVYNGVKTALWGENGSGKTTLLNLIASSHEGISIVPKARIAYFRQGFENLIHEETVLKNVMRDSVQQETVARTILARLLIQGEAVHKRVGVLSGGEKIKVAFAKLFVSNANVLLLDEPTNYLDMQSIEALENVLKDYEGTVLFVSHDRAFVNGVADRLLILRDRRIEAFDGTLEEYETRRSSAGGRIKSASKNTLKAAVQNGQITAAQSTPKRDAPGNDSESLPDGIERTLLQMRLTEIITKLSSATGDSEALEEEYRRLVELLRQK